MKKQQDNGALPWVLLAVPVLWAAAIMAYAYEDGMNLFDLLGRFTVLMERPFAIGRRTRRPARNTAAPAGAAHGRFAPSTGTRTP